jgi:murein DD-endopeptidase MepM/ murein hydrolase activator NlpD
MTAFAPLAAAAASALALTGGALLTGATANPAVGSAAVVDRPRPAAAAPTHPPTVAPPPRASPSAPAGLPTPVRPPAASTSSSRFDWPLSPRPAVLRPFAVGLQRWSPGHRGIDLAAGDGQPVLAAGSGTVRFAGPLAGRGVVVIDHGDGLHTTYEPVRAGVRLGDVVSLGQPLGRLATAGAHCAPTCLHWGAASAGAYLDPLSLLRGRRPPILLPLGFG